MASDLPHLPDCGCDECVGVPAFDECAYFRDAPVAKCGECVSCLAVDEFNRRLCEKEALANGGIGEMGLEVLSWAE